MTAHPALRVRAWHLVDRIMYGPESSYVLLMPVGGWSNMVPMLSTGTTDHNGRELFVGDIVQSKSGKRGVIQFALGLFGINWDYAKNQDPEWTEGQMYGSWGQRHNLRRLDDMDNLGALMSMDPRTERFSVEVIGDIYQNPELIPKEVA